MSSMMEPWTKEQYAKAAAEYLAQLPLEHFMEAQSQSIQRSIFLHSFEQLAVRIPDCHYFNELLVQYRVRGELRQVVPDNMIVLGPLDSELRTSFAVEREQSPILWTLEYVSQHNKRKDYEDSYLKYEELKVPYYLIYDPEDRDLRLFRHDGTRYRQVNPDDEGRYALAELEVQVGIVEEWVRFWHRGVLVALPSQLAATVATLEAQIQSSQEELEQQDEMIEEIRSELDHQQRQLWQSMKANERNEKQLRKNKLALQQKDKQLQEKDQQLQQAVADLRPVVLLLAQQAGRQDILAAVPTVQDLGQLRIWMQELLGRAG